MKSGKYIVATDNGNNGGTELFETLAEANARAAYEWRYADHEKTDVVVGFVTLDDCGTDDDGNPSFLFWESYTVPDGAWTMHGDVIEDLRSRYGAVAVDGVEYVLLEQAYMDCPIGEYTYQAQAIKSTDAPDSDDTLTVYHLEWEMLPDEIEKCEECSADHSWYDEGNACDWNSPSGIQKTYCGYSFRDGRII